MVRLWYTLPGHRLVLPDRPRGAGLPGEAGGRRDGALHAAGALRLQGFIFGIHCQLCSVTVLLFKLSLECTHVGHVYKNLIFRHPAVLWHVLQYSNQSKCIPDYYPSFGFLAYPKNQQLIDKLSTSLLKFHVIEV